MINAGDLINFRCLHTDGQWYRHWQTTIESVDANTLVTCTPAGSWIEDIQRGMSSLPNKMRNFYWSDKLYNLIEVFGPDDQIVEIYINIASPVRPAGKELHYVDHELDVIKFPGQPARIIDQDEFEAAIELYGYSPEFQAQCWQAAEEALTLAETWLESKTV